MKVALINNLYFPYQRGGAEQVMNNMLSRLKQSGQEVFIITSRPKKTNELRTSKEEQKIYYLPSSYYHLAEHSLGWRAAWHLMDLFNFKKQAQIKKILETEKPDLVITHNLMGLGLLLPRLLKKLKIEHEHYLHDVQLLHPSGLILYGQEKKLRSLSAKLYQAMTRGLFGSPAKIISPSQWLLEEHRARGFFKKSNLEVRPFKNNPLKVLKRPPFKNFLFVGQIETHKGIFLLLEAFRKTTSPELKLSIIGDGQKLAAAKEIALTDGRIKFLGRLSLEEVKKVMAASEALIVPSLCYENSPTIISEAHEVDLPVIASDLGGIPEIINANDRLFKPEATELTKILELVSIDS